MPRERDPLCQEWRVGWGMGMKSVCLTQHDHIELPAVAEKVRRTISGQALSSPDSVALARPPQCHSGLVWHVAVLPALQPVSGPQRRSSAPHTGPKTGIGRRRTIEDATSVCYQQKTIMDQPSNTFLG